MRGESSAPLCPVDHHAPDGALHVLWAFISKDRTVLEAVRKEMDAHRHMSAKTYLEVKLLRIAMHDTAARRRVADAIFARPDMDKLAEMIRSAT